MSTNTELDAREHGEITDVWTGSSASFDLYTHDDRQFVAFYAADQSITAGQRRLGEADWTLATVSGERNNVWDHHNSLTMAIDDHGHIHLVGDVHVDPLNYFRTAEPLDVTTFERVESMVGDREARTTYPAFLRGPDGELVFKYRDGMSGAGDWVYNVYDHDSETWSRLLDEPLTQGGERANAYPTGPTPGPDGYYHLVWCWRDHPAAQTNHDLYYVRSADLREWETSRGEPVSLPIRFHDGDLIDPVAPYGGLLNSRIRLGFDSRDRVVVSYMKFDPDGNTQVYNARAESDGWTTYETSDWDYRFTFGGKGTLGAALNFGGVETGPDGRLVQSYDHPKYGTGRWVLDEETLDPVEWLSPWHRYPEGLETVQADHPHLQVNWAEDSGTAPGDDQYALRWEGRDPQYGRDAEQEEAPPPTSLQWYRFERS